MKKLILIFLLLAVNIYAADESEVLTCAAMSANTWTETGGTGCTIMGDASDATYFGTAAAGDSAVYTLSDAAYVYTTIDSVAITWRERCGNVGKQELMFMGIRVGSDTTYPSAYRPTLTSFADSTRQMTVAPDAGAWTVTDVDAMEILFINTNNVSGGNNFVADYTVTVWGTREAGGSVDISYIRRIKEGEGK